MAKDMNTSSRNGKARTSMEFAGLAAAVAFIAAGAITSAGAAENNSTQLHQEMRACLNDTGDALGQVCETGSAARNAVWLAQASTQGSDCPGGEPEPCEDDEDYEDYEDYDDYLPDTDDGFSFEYLPYDVDTLSTVDETDTTVLRPYRSQHWPSPNSGAGRTLTAEFEQGSLHTCLAQGGAVMRGNKAHPFACWFSGSVKAHKVKINVPRYDDKAYRMLGKCDIGTHSITITPPSPTPPWTSLGRPRSDRSPRSGTYSCVMTPMTVKRAVEKGRKPRTQKPSKRDTNPGRPAVG